MEVAGKLGSHRLVFHSGDAVGMDFFVPHFRIPLMPDVRMRFGHHHRKIRDARDHGSIDIIEDKPEILPEQRALFDVVVGMGDIQLHFGIELAIIAVPQFRVIAVLGGIDVAQDPLHVPVVRFHDGGFQIIVHRLQAEIHLREFAGYDLDGSGLIPQQRGRQHPHVRIARFQHIIAVQIGRYADGRSLEVNGDEGNPLSGRSIGNTTLHPGCLSQGGNGR